MGFLFPNTLLEASFLRRYKRFFIDAQMPDGSTVVAHCANSGSMKSCLETAVPVYLLPSDNPKRKLAFGLELMRFFDGLACLNTQRANQFVGELFNSYAHLKNKRLKITNNKPENTKIIGDFIGANLFKSDFAECDFFQSEAAFHEKTRFDFLLEKSDSATKTWVEIKSVSLRENDTEIGFPDSVTERGQKHLVDLMSAIEQGHKAFLFYVVMRGSDINAEILAKQFKVASHIDKQYGFLFEKAIQSGVNIRILIPKITPEGIFLRGYFKFNSI